MTLQLLIFPSSITSDSITEELLPRDMSRNSTLSHGSGYLMKNVLTTSSAADDMEEEEDVIESGRSFLNMFSFASHILNTFQGGESISMSYASDKSEDGIPSPFPPTRPDSAEQTTTTSVVANFWGKAQS